MSEIQFYELKCRRCGGQLRKNGETYVCESCGKIFEKQVVSDNADQLRDVLNEQKQEAVANLRRQLWAEMHETYIDSEKIADLAREIKKYIPDDYFANFCEIANDGSDRQLSQFLLTKTSQNNMADYADVVLDFMLRSVTPSNLNTISLFIERAFKGDTQNYDKYITRYEEEAKKAKSGIYELTITRDVFLAYSSKDMNKVLELCDYLERNKISCFLALRNLSHGRGAANNYDQALKTAIDNCKTVVFVSSTNSRDMTCDALIKELPYIKKKDFENAPPECKRNYYKIPPEYLMPRVQYLIEDFKNDGSVAEGIVDEFFHDLEWCRSKEEVARRVSEYLIETRETAAEKAERESREFQQQLEEERRKQKELELKIAEAEKARAEAESKKAAIIDTPAQSSGGVSAAQINAWLVRAEQESEQGLTSSAKSYYEKVKDAAPDNYRAWLGLFYIANNTTRSAGLKIWDDCGDLSEAKSRIKDNDYTLSTFDSYNFKNALRYAAGGEADNLKRFKEESCLKLRNGNASILEKLYRLADGERNLAIARQQFEFIIQKTPENAAAWLGLFFILNNATRREGIKVRGECGNLNEARASREINKKTLDSFNSTEFKNALRYSDIALKAEITALKENVTQKIAECDAAIADKIYASAESHRASNQALALQEYKFVLEIDGGYSAAYKGMLLCDAGAYDLDSLKSRLTEDTLIKLKNGGTYKSIHDDGSIDDGLKREIKGLDDAIRSKTDALLKTRSKEVTEAKNNLETQKKNLESQKQTLERRLNTARQNLGKHSEYYPKKLHPIVVFLLVVYYPIGIIYLIYRAVRTSNNKKYYQYSQEYNRVKNDYNNFQGQYESQINPYQGKVNRAVAKLNDTQALKTYFDKIYYGKI